ncbi:MAG TPA: hypothetical protein VJP02_04575 [Candidatus Sulfotelmatobacter sp.]|nr:hypothetical protein [Candidatus Sulfotelmatobacter sp.]
MPETDSTTRSKPPKLKIKYKYRFRFVGIEGHDYPVDFYIDSDLHICPAGACQRLALYLNGRFAPAARLAVLRGIIKERGWKISAEFIDSDDGPGPAFELFLEDSHARRHDAAIE